MARGVMRNVKRMRRRRLSWFLILSPWICVLLLVTAVVHLRIIMESTVRVTPITDLPRSLAIHANVVSLCSVLALLAFPAWVVSLCSPKWRLRVLEHTAQLFIYFFGLAVIIVSPVFDSTGLAFSLFSW